jgi:hypothetical protein
VASTATPRWIQEKESHRENSTADMHKNVHNWNPL